MWSGEAAYSWLAWLILVGLGWSWLFWADLHWTAKSWLGLAGLGSDCLVFLAVTGHCSIAEAAISNIECWKVFVLKCFFVVFRSSLYTEIAQIWEARGINHGY